VAAVVAGLLVLDLFQSELSYATAIALLGVGLFAALAVAAPKSRPGLFHFNVDRADLVMIAGVYAVVVAFYRLAFVIVDNNDLLLFAFFAAGLLVGVAGPVVYTVWGRRRSLATLGLSGAISLRPSSWRCCLPPFSSRSPSGDTTVFPAPRISSHSQEWR
jgi:hypothetical protein